MTEVNRDTPSNANNIRNKIRMIEFFSGIGGMRYGIEDAIRQLSSSRPNDEHRVHDDVTDAEPLLKSCHAYEISIYANRTYAHNFGEDCSLLSSSKKNHKRPQKRKQKQKRENNSDFSVRTKLVEQLHPHELVSHAADLWTMSPPCQPFTTTRNAKRKDTEDGRSRGFASIMESLRRMEGGCRPRWILLENVRGFVGSDALDDWYDCLDVCGYSYRQYLISPTQLGIPNNRTRYYMICERSDRFFPRSNRSKVGIGAGVGIVPSSCNPQMENIDDDDHHDDGNDGSEEKEQRRPISCSVPISRPVGSRVGQTEQEKKEMENDERLIDNMDSNTIRPRRLRHYIRNPPPVDDDDNDYHLKYIIPDSVLEERWAKDIPIVNPYDRMTHCFTAAYGRQIHRATGSLLLMTDDDDDLRNDKEDDDDDDDDPKRGKSIEESPLCRKDMTTYSRRIRRFTPDELLHLFGFPSSFQFPGEGEDDGDHGCIDGEISLEHRYKLIGNSVNVLVVSQMAQILLGGGGGGESLG